MSKLVNAVLDSYSLGKIKKIEKPQKGIRTNNFIVETENGKYFLKQNRKKDPEILNTKILALEIFKSHGIPLELPIKNNDHLRITHHEDHYYSIFPFIQGYQVKKNEVTQMQLQDFSETLAKIHLVSNKVDLNQFTQISTRKRPLEYFTDRQKQAIDFLKNKPTLEKIDKKALNLLEHKYSKAKDIWETYNHLDTGPRALVHGDYQLDNVFFGKDQKVKSIIDFDNLKVSSFYSEIIWTLAISFDFAYHTGKQPQKLLQSYNSINKLDRNILRNAVIEYYFGLILASWFEHSYYFEKNKKVAFLIENELKRLVYLEKNIDTLADQIINF